MPKIKSTLKSTPVSDPTRPIPETKVYVGKWVVDYVDVDMIRSLVALCGEVKVGFSRRFLSQTRDQIECAY